MSINSANSSRSHCLYSELGALYNQLPTVNATVDGKTVQRKNVYVTAPLQNLVLPVWKCPSSALPDAQPDGWTTWWTNYKHQVPAYIGIMGAYPDPAGNTSAIFNSNYGGWWSNNGILIPNARSHMTDVTDGLSNTIIVAEQSGKVQNCSYASGDARNGYYTPWGGPTFNKPINALAAGTDSWGSGLTCVAYQINSKTCGSGANTSYVPSSILNSFHTNGISALLGDGSVRFINDSFDFVMLQRMCCKADGMVVTE
ncbi:MAG: DUF1559 domain-containing protein [Bacteroidales bacterium]|nr:DUF1559 domain-containing protein [Bacteroidales bacterium]